MPYWFDGNNLIGQPAARARTDRETRRQFLSFLSARSRSRGGRFTVFFDGDDPDRAVPPPGVRVRYSAPLSTDDAIIRDLAGSRAPSEIIIITNDHSLTARCRDSGAKTMTWEKFAATASPATPGRSRQRAAKDERVNVDEWARYFGLDDEALE